MTNEMERAALIMSRAASTLVELEAMKVANRQRQHAGQADAYGEEAFYALHERHEQGIAALYG